VRSRDFGSRRTARRIVINAKTFILAKEIRAMRAKSLRDKKSLRDHAATPGNAGERELSVVRLRVAALVVRRGRMISRQGVGW
jgi:hypothetical protein